MTDIIQALIIDDDEDSIFVLQSLLAKLDINTISIHISPDILTDITQIPLPDIIFLDLNMPILNGYEILAELQQIADYTTIPIIAHTMYLDQLNDAYEAGFHSFLGKPVNRHTFAEKLELIFQGEHIWEVN